MGGEVAAPFLIAAAALLLNSGPAHAQACGARQDLLEHLEDKYRELPAGMGMTTGGAVMELLVAGDGSWTLIVTLPGQASCLVAAGRHWVPAPPPPPKPDREM